MHRAHTAPAAGRPAGESPPRLAAGRIEIIFAWCGDRWGHRVMLDSRIIAVSVEGPLDDGADPRWPASPVLTEVLTTPAQGPAIVGVGSAGRSHFSASITPHSRGDDTLVFEIACRIQETPIHLGSTYLTGEDPAELVQIAAEPGAGGLPRTIAWRYTIGPQGIRPGGATARPTN